jgi:5'-nucleotidase
VLFSDQSQRICDEHGLNAFFEHEERNARQPLSPGPFAKLLKTLWYLQKVESGAALIRTALVTARSSPAHERVLRTLQSWGVRVDEVFFLGPLPKEQVLKEFGAHIFFDDQPKNCTAASKVVTTALVPREEEGTPGVSPTRSQEG